MRDSSGRLRHLKIHYAKLSLEEDFSKIPMGVQKASQHTGKLAESAVPRVFFEKF